jgi:hypothetical protein
MARKEDPSTMTTAARRLILLTALLIVAATYFVHSDLRIIEGLIYSSFETVEKSTVPRDNSIFDALLINAFNDTLDTTPRNDTKCFRWLDENSDHWWTHHPLWKVDIENDTHTCFRHDPTLSYYLQIYRNQFLSNCTNSTTRYIYDSGWSADLVAGISLSLIHAVRTGSPLAIRPFKYDWGWHYAAMKPKGLNPTCPRKDMFCYFLPLTNCPAARSRALVTTTGFTVYTVDLQQSFMVYNYVARQQQWLRREVYDFLKDISLPTPCAVIHVRRADVILHFENARKYYPVSDYVAKLPLNRRKHVLLLTDDANAIEEAVEFHSDINWIFLNRTRYRGSSGGWEQQIPSGNPKSEVITILATLKLVERCDSVVYGESGFASMLVDAMEKPLLRKARVDEGLKDMISWNNSDSDKKLVQLLQSRRQNKASPRDRSHGRESRSG